jgi:hypothetical protein
MKLLPGAVVAATITLKMIEECYFAPARKQKEAHGFLQSTLHWH